MRAVEKADTEAKHVQRNARKRGAARTPGPRHRLRRSPQQGVKELIQLCYPDKHAGSPLSQRVTTWLLTMRGVQ